MGIQLHKQIIPPAVEALAGLKLPSSKPKAAIATKKLVRRTGRDYSQPLRRGYQYFS